MDADFNMSLDVNELIWGLIFIFLVQKSDFLVVLGNLILMILFRFIFRDDAG